MIQTALQLALSAEDQAHGQAHAHRRAKPRLSVKSGKFNGNDDSHCVFGPKASLLAIKVSVLLVSRPPYKQG
jgi:hypothetical protein